MLESNNADDNNDYNNSMRCSHSTHLTRFPFEWRHPIGYLIAITLEYVVAVYAFELLSALLILALDLVLIAVDSTQALKDDLKLINKNAASKKHRLLTLNRLANFIQSHSAWKKLNAPFSVNLEISEFCSIQK